MKINSFRNLIVWQKSMDLVNKVYHLTEKFPRSEQYGLIAQMRRAAVAIPSNIAEGFRRKHLGEYLQFLSIANGSAAELETQLYVSRNLDFITAKDFNHALAPLEEIQKMLHSLIRKLRSSKTKT